MRFVAVLGVEYTQFFLSRILSRTPLCLLVCFLLLVANPRSSKIGVIMACALTPLSSVHLTGAESFHHYLLIGENLRFLSPLSLQFLSLCFSDSGSSSRFSNLYACMDCYWCSRSFREHVIHEAATSCRFCMYRSGYSFLGLMGCVYLILWTRDAVYVCSIFFMLCWHLELDACIHNIDVCTSTSAVCVLLSRRF
jgi:hypothetical protein